MTYVLTRLKNNVVATGASKKLVATILGWNQSLIAAMYLHNNNNSNNNNNNTNNNNNGTITPYLYRHKHKVKGHYPTALLFAQEVYF